MSPLPKDLAHCLKFRREAAKARALASRSPELAPAAFKKAAQLERAIALMLATSPLLRADARRLKRHADALALRIADLRRSAPVRAARLLRGYHCLIRVYHHLVMARPL